MNATTGLQLVTKTAKNFPMNFMLPMNFMVMRRALLIWDVYLHWTCICQSCRIDPSLVVKTWNWYNYTNSQQIPWYCPKVHNFTDDSSSMSYVVPTRDIIYVNYNILWIQKSSWELGNVIVSLFLDYGMQKMVMLLNLEWNEPRRICQSVIFNLAKRSQLVMLPND